LTRQIDEYHYYVSTFWRIDQFDLNRKPRGKMFVPLAGLPPAAITTNIGMTPAEFDRLRSTTG
jgi:hypothetical protein